MSRSRLITYYAGFSSHLKFSESKENLEKEETKLEPLENLVLNSLEQSNDFEIRNSYLGWCSLFLHVINGQQIELYNLSYNSICKTQVIKCNCNLSDPFDLKSLNCNNKETYLICNDRKVKCWPRNNFTKELVEVKDLEDDSETETKLRVKQVSVGNTYVCALLESGKVKVINEDGLSDEFELEDEDDEIEYVSCGLEFVLLLSKKGLVYGHGSNIRGQLGIETSLTEEVTDGCKLIEALEGLKVQQISAGGWHSLVLENGNVYAFGWNESGQLGVESEDLKTSGIVDTPTLVNLPVDLDFIMISAGSRHSFAVSSEGYLYVWGWNKYSQLGFNVVDLKEVRIPKKLNLKGKVVSIDCKFWSSLIQVYYP